MLEKLTGLMSTGRRDLPLPVVMIGVGGIAALGAYPVTQTALVAAGVTLPVLGVLLHFVGRKAVPDEELPQSVLPDENALIAYLDRLRKSPGVTHGGVVMVEPLIAMDQTSFGPDPSQAELIDATAAALRGVVRAEDVVTRYGARRLAIAFSPGQQGSLEGLIQVAMRIQSRLEGPVAVGNTHVSVISEIGVCPPLPDDSRMGTTIASAAADALNAAQRQGPRVIRIHSDTPQDDADLQLLLAQELDTALAEGHIVPYFQPQISTDTGAITGVEALARWHHADHGTLMPGQFLPTVEAAGASGRLTQRIVAAALDALADWDARGIFVPQVSVNFTHEDLSDPTLPQRLAWMIDRAGLTPDRLGIEVLETVLSVPGDDTVPRILKALKDLGCTIDLDDFGTGQASIASIRRFSIDRIKIDRTFIRGLDSDYEQQSMVAAIVTMAEQLKLGLLAEGIETAGEHARAAQLGCGFVQGYGIGRPMQGDAIPGWLSQLDQINAETPVPLALRHIAANGACPPVTPPREGRGGKTA